MATKRKVTKKVAPINPRGKAIDMLYTQMAELEDRKFTLENEASEIEDSISSLEDAIDILENMD